MLYIENPEAMPSGVITYHEAEDLEWTAASGTILTSSTSSASSASTCIEPVDPEPDDAVTRLGDIFRNMPQRQPLSPREKHRRRRRNWLAKLSRRRNRR